MMRTSAVLHERFVEIPAAPSRHARGILSVPHEARALVTFAHGSGSGRFSARNQFVARNLQEAGLGTLLIDLLEEDEAQDRRRVFDIPLLADRLESSARWLRRDAETRRLRLGYFGASTGSAAALLAASREPDLIGTVVSRGGRPDLAHDALPEVRCPTLLIVGGRDVEVLELNRQALALLRCPRELAIVPEATHLFPEPGALDQVAELAGAWFLRHLGGRQEARAVP